MSFICKLCLLCLWAIGAIPQSSWAITDAEKSIIHRGINQGKVLAQALERKDFDAAIKQFGLTIPSWTDALGYFGDFIGIFLPAERPILDEMRRGFSEVNIRLDAIKKELREVKEAIDWAVVKVNFQRIESKINILDEELKTVYRAGNPKEAVAEFIRIYEKDYSSEAVELYRAIVKQDQVFSENILTAGMKYTEFHRRKMQGFMRGLIALMMKGASVEIAHERFKMEDRGEIVIWRERLQECQESMKKTDRTLKGKWLHLFRGEMDSMVAECGCSHKTLHNRMMDFLQEKYYWRNWFVLVYSPVSGSDNHYMYSSPNYVHLKYRHHGHNYVVATSDSSLYFDANKVRAGIKDVLCCIWPNPYECMFREPQGANRMITGLPAHGVFRVALNIASLGVKENYWRSSNMGRVVREYRNLLCAVNGSFGCRVKHKEPFKIIYFG